MKQLVFNYVKMRKAGFFHKIFLYSIFLIIPSLINAVFKLKNNFFIGFPMYFFVIMICIYFPFSIINNISENRYTFCLTLPIKISDVIKLAYLQTYLVYIVALIGICLLSIFTNTTLYINYLLAISLFLLSTNFFFPYMSSTELALRTYESSKGLYWYIMTIGFWIILDVFILILSNIISPSHSYYGKIIAILTINTASALTLKISYRKTLRKAMGM